ncbi:MAG: hypothetical protein WCE79_29445 [Xanthobacteraceae bacterium]
MREQLENLLFRCRRQMSALDDRRTELFDEIRGYEELLEADPDSVTPEIVERLIRRSLGNLSPTWMAILARLLSFKRFNATDIQGVSQELNRKQNAIKVLSHGSVRFQLTTYAKSGLIKRIGNGDYRLSEKARAALELVVAAKPSGFVLAKEFGPELPALAQERRMTPANPRPSRAQHERG